MHQHRLVINEDSFPSHLMDGMEDIHLRHPATTEAPIDLGGNGGKMKIFFNHTDGIEFAALNQSHK